MRRAEPDLSLVGTTVVKRPAPLSLESEDDATHAFAPSPGQKSSPLLIAKSPGRSPIPHLIESAELELNGFVSSPAHQSDPLFLVRSPCRTPGNSTLSRTVGAAGGVLGKALPGSLSKGKLARLSNSDTSSANGSGLPNSPCGPKGQPASLSHSRSAPSPGPRLSQRATAMLRRRVTFCPTPSNTSHVVTPYAAVYGQHPKLFDFNRKGEMELSNAGIADEMRKSREMFSLPSPD